MALHRFIGDRDVPTPIASLRGRRPILGTGKLPEALSLMARTRTLYTVASADHGPSVSIESINEGGRHLWKVQVPVTEQFRGARPGITLERHPAIRFLDETAESTSFRSHRPDWIDALPLPRLVLDRP
jgi:hypothetical protein